MTRMRDATARDTNNYFFPHRDRFAISTSNTTGTKDLYTAKAAIEYSQCTAALALRASIIFLLYISSAYRSCYGETDSD
jgi:hypothetical protein